MKLTHPPLSSRPNSSRAGSVLILVLWVSFGLVTLSLYFANSAGFELKGADNRAAGLEAEHAIQGGLRYVQYVMKQYATNGLMPDPLDYQAQAVPVGEARFWLIGRGNGQRTPVEPVFELVDEASKLNLNTATVEMLSMLPRMTPQLAAAIVDWRDADATPTDNGAEDEVYQRLQPARKCKNAPFETVEELRLVYGADLEILLGEDLNANGVLDPNEDDGDTAPPSDNRDGRLDPGVLEYLTVYSSEPATLPDGTRRINVNTGRQQWRQLFVQKFGDERGREIERNVPNGRNVSSVLEFFIRSRMTGNEFAQVHTNLTAANGGAARGLINVNTASAVVLACVPGIGVEKAASVVAFRAGNPGRLDSIAWVAEVLDEESAIRAGRYLTGASYQFSVDIAAVGRYGRGYRRIRYIVDNSASAPRVVFQRDLTHLGWALGDEARETMRVARETRR